jgi:hypothetical protein
MSAAVSVTPLLHEPIESNATRTGLGSSRWNCAMHLG